MSPPRFATGLLLAGLVCAAGLACVLAGIGDSGLQAGSDYGAAAPCAPDPPSFQSTSETRLAGSPHPYLPAACTNAASQGTTLCAASLSAGDESREALRSFSPLHRRPPPLSS